MFWKVDNTQAIKFYHLILQHKPFIVYDLETTGKKKDIDRIVQFSANRYEVINGIYQMVKSIDLYIKPPFLMEQAVVDIHGITNEFLADKPREEDVFPVIYEFFNDPDCIITGYNILKFDNVFMKHMYERNGALFDLDDERFVDIYGIAKSVIHPKEVEDHSLKLSNVASYLGITEDFNFHSAAEDIQATWLVGVELAKLYKKMFKDPWNNRENPRILNLNKYKKSSSVDRVYVMVQFDSGEKEKLFYDVRLKGWVDEGDTVIYRTNMPYLHYEATKIAEQMGFESLDKFDGKVSGADIYQMRMPGKGQIAYGI